MTPGPWLLRLWGQDLFMPDTWVEVRSGETTRVEILDPEGRLMRSPPLIRREQHRGDSVQLRGLLLPAGNYSLVAHTDSGL